MGNSPFPMEMIRKLNFYEPNLVLQGANPFIVREWRINSAYDPDPLLGGGSTAGYNKIAAIYGQYRVENFRVRYEVAANEPAIACAFGLIFRDAQPSTTTLTYIDAQNQLEIAPTTGPQIVGETAGMSIYRSKWISIRPSAILGNPIEYMADLSFQSSVTTNPTQTVWLAFIVTSPGALINLTNGVILNIYMEQTVRFFSLSSPLEIVRNTQTIIDNRKPEVICNNVVNPQDLIREIPRRSIEKLEQEQIVANTYIQTSRLQEIASQDSTRREEILKEVDRLTQELNGLKST